VEVDTIHDVFFSQETASKSAIIRIIEAKKRAKVAQSLTALQRQSAAQKKPFSGLFRRLAAVQIVAARSITSSNRTLVTSRMRSIFSVASLTDRLRYRERVRNQSAADNRR
jgi:hypothetical protein